MYCPNCGNQDSGEGRFCRRCGTHLRLVALALAGKSLDKGDDDLVRKLAIQQEIIDQQLMLQRRRARLTGGIITTCVGSAMIVLLTLSGESEGPWPGMITVVVGVGLILSGLFSRRPKNVSLHLDWETIPPELGVGTPAPGPSPTPPEPETAKPTQPLEGLKSSRHQAE